MVLTYRNVLHELHRTLAADAVRLAREVGSDPCLCTGDLYISLSRILSSECARLRGRFSLLRFITPIAFTRTEIFRLRGGM